jgi:hypothetical protein
VLGIETAAFQNLQTVVHGEGYTHVQRVRSGCNLNDTERKSSLVPGKVAVLRVHAALRAGRFLLCVLLEHAAAPWGGGRYWRIV